MPSPTSIDPASPEFAVPDGAAGEPGDPRDLACPSDHAELDRLLLQEAREAAEALRKASAALHAASAVVLDAVALVREERAKR